MPEADPADVNAAGLATDDEPEKQIDELSVVSAAEVQSNTGGSAAQSTSSGHGEVGVDAPTVDDGVTESNEAYKGIPATVLGEAQQKAEVELFALIERILTQQASQDAADIASALARADAQREEAVADALVRAKAESDRVLEETESSHVEESQKARQQADEEVTAAIDRVRSEEAERHAIDIARVQTEFEGRRVADLERARQALVESFSTLTGSIEQGAQG